MWCFDLRGDAHNYHNLPVSVAFTLSHVTCGIYQAAHQTSARFAEGVSEFDAVGLTPHWHQQRRAVSGASCGESPVRMGLTVAEDLLLPNGCRFVIGAVEWVDFDPVPKPRMAFWTSLAWDQCALGDWMPTYTAPAHLPG